jgi:hypothetical protein
MGRSTRKLNFLIEEDVSRDLESLVPLGQRSKVVNQALRKELELIRRKKVLKRLHAAPSSTKRFSNREIVEGLAKDRRSH